LMPLLVPLGQGLLYLGHHRLQGLAKSNGQRITLYISFGGLMAPWSRWKGILAQGFALAIDGHRHTGSSILNDDLLGRVG
jgi:hypothetical protein